ncbi:MAG: hypothetical protein ACOYNL_00865 [Rickettsiales bacterium]
MKQLCCVALSFTLLLAVPAYAGVGKVSSPNVEKGVAEIEYSGTRYGDSSGSSNNNKQNHAIELEYGFTDRFMFGLEMEIERESPHSTKIDGFGVEAQYELTQQGNWWLNSAIKGEYLHATHAGDADALELLMLASRQWGATQATLNVELAREMGNNRSSGLGLSSRFQAIHAFNDHFAPGIEWDADYGRVNKLGDSDRQEQYLGPVVTGELFELGKGEVDYAVGYYWGLTKDSANKAARLHVSYEFPF